MNPTILPRSTPFTILQAMSLAAAFGLTADSAPGAAIFVNGSVPDWDQPYSYLAPNGPGPDPLANFKNQWNAWCAPTSAANLAGHWNDYWNISIGDGVAFPASPAWPSVNWHDYQADAARPAPRGPGLGGPPYVTTDIGWFMDTNRGVAYDVGPSVMGGDDFANLNHVGTYLKDIDIGLKNFLNQVGSGWTTGTQGKAFSSGLKPDGVTLAAIHLNEASAFAEVTMELALSHTMLLAYRNWAINPAAVAPLGPGAAGTEGANGGTYYTWTTAGATNPFDENWNNAEDGTALGHVVTAVGAITAGDAADKGPALGIGPTNWVIVHDNWGATPRNVIVPFNFNGTWVANTNAVPEPGAALLLAGGLGMLGVRRRRSPR